MRFLSRHPSDDALHDYLSNALDPRTHDRVAAHLAQCATCQNALRFATRLRDALQSSADTAPSGIFERAQETRAAGERRILPRPPELAQPAVRAQAQRIAMAVGVAAGVLLTLSVGFVIGASASYASAAVPDSTRPSFALFPMRAINALRCPSPAVTAPTEQVTLVAPQAVPVVDIAVSAKTTETFGAVLGLKETSEGRVLINDAVRRMIRLFEPSLATSTIAFDSVPGSARSYGGGPNIVRAPLYPFAGDSSLFRDSGTRDALLVLDGKGQIARAIATSAMYEFSTSTFADPKGRMFYESFPTQRVVNLPMSASLRPMRLPPGFAGGSGGGRAGGGAPGEPMTPVGIFNVRDSVPILRLDFETGRTDTVAYFQEPMGSALPPWVGAIGGRARTVLVNDKDGKPASAKTLVNPAQATDAWAVLADGTIAVVRAHDYHVDWISPDGKKSSSPKLPIELKRLTDADKQQLIDSVRTKMDSVDAWARRRADKTPAPGDSIAAFDTVSSTNGRGGRAGCPNGNIQCPPMPRRWPIDFAPLSEIADYYPPFNKGAALADRDGNLWILPRMTKLSTQGELVYDVVNPKQGLVRHVRLPLGRSIAGFGKGGVVYLQAGSIGTGFTIERATVPGAKTTQH